MISRACSDRAGLGTRSGRNGIPLRFTAFTYKDLLSNSPIQSAARVLSKTGRKSAIFCVVSMTKIARDSDSREYPHKIPEAQAIA